jgi:hypothetical protein
VIKVPASNQKNLMIRKAFLKPKRFFLGQRVTKKLSSLRIRLPSALDWTNDFSGSDTAGTNTNGLGSTVDHRLHFFEVGEPAGAGLNIGMGD